MKSYELIHIHIFSLQFGYFKQLSEYKRREGRDGERKRDENAERIEKRENSG